MTEGVLAGKVAVITGGTRGLGLAIARAYAQEGASVVIASRSVEGVEQAVKTLSTEGGQVSGQPYDVGELGQVESLAAHALTTFGRLDVWVNNAGISAPYGPTIHIPPEEVTRVIQTNILGVYHGTLVALRHFLPKGQGKLINVLGRGSRGPVPMQNAYAASKAWMRSFTLALAEEYKGSGVEILAFRPGMVDTDMLRKPHVVAGYEEHLKSLETVIRMWAHAPDVPAREAVWLASAATDGRSGLEVKLLGPLAIIGGLLREGLRRLLRQPAPPIEVDITSLPPASLTDVEE